MLLVGRSSTVLILREQAMHHRVGITADRRREMGIIIEAEAEVTDVMRGILSLHHGTERHTLHNLCLALSVNVVHELIDTLDHCLTRAVGLHLQAKGRDELPQRLHLLRIRVVVDTIREDLGFLTFRHTSNGLCHGAVG